MTKLEALKKDQQEVETKIKSLMKNKLELNQQLGELLEELQSIRRDIKRTPTIRFKQRLEQTEYYR